ncbi:MAG TPA: bacterial transcriptional activator domain-containing protein [Pseudonocardia sp.]|jgi:DNA-binding SARP family transcriptional activator|nr:bacterial transcriptional activator domain-containing protein [Pseudonocardia sp.]
MSTDQRRSCAPVRGLRLRVLGCIELTTPEGADRTPADLDGLRLLAALAVAGPSRSRSELATTLWPELEDASASAALSDAIFTVADLVVEVGDDGAGLALSPEISVDLTDVMARLRGWDQDPSIALTATAEQISVLGDDLLPGWTEGWVDQERERFHKLRLHSLESLCQLLTQAGRHEPAIRAGELMVDAEPLREAARRALIEAHLAAGNVSEAVHQYDTFVELCASFGFAPDSELRNFFPPSPAWPVLHVRRSIHPGQAVLVGRGVRFDVPARRAQVGAGAAFRG